MGDRRGCIDGFGGERDHLKGLGVDGRIILIWVFRNSKGGHGLD
jgi:hypothetical protein